MIKIKPISGPQTFSIIPSSYSASVLNAASLVFINDETNKQDTGATFTWELSSNGNFVEISLTPSVTLSEGQMFTIELMNGSNVYYRDTLFVTALEAKNQKYVSNSYTEYNSGDNEYIVY